jgi:hypothetical protein
MHILRKTALLGSLLSLFAAPAMAQIVYYGAPAYAPPPPDGWYDNQEAAWRHHEWREHEWRAHHWREAHDWGDDRPPSPDDDN